MWFRLLRVNTTHRKMYATGENASTSISITTWLLLTAVTLSLYIFGTRNYDFFRKRNFASTNPKLPFFGDMLAELLGLRASPDSIKQRYNWGKGHRVFGFFEFTKPIFLIRDPDIVREITVKQFGNFTNRRPILCEKSDPLFHKNIFTLEDDTWRNMRSRLSPSFTPSKLKTMFPIVSKCAERMTDYLKQKYDALHTADSTGQSITCDIKDLCTRMANDVFLSTSLGVQCDSMKTPENEIYQMGKLLTDFNTWRSLVFHGYLVLPNLMKLMTLPILDRKATNFFGSLVREVTGERRAKEIVRSDLLQFLMDARRRRKPLNSCERRDCKEIVELADEDMLSQVVIFLFAGFETLSTALSFTIYALSHHHGAQTRLQEEIDQVMTKTNGNLTYKTIQRMKYLDSVIKESLRMYPPAVETARFCSADTTITTVSGDIVLPKDSDILIPIMGLHYDPEYWEDPNKFNPDRFNENNQRRMHNFTYMPFGAGPRMCIGERLALLEMKMALVQLLARFELLPSARCPHPARFQACFNLTPKGGFWCRARPRCPKANGPTPSNAVSQQFRSHQRISKADELQHQLSQTDVPPLYSDLTFSGHGNSVTLIRTRSRRDS